MNQAKDGGKPQQERRRALVDATMTAIAERGFSNLTLAHIAGVAGLSAGIVNFYFTSKEALLLETLRAVAEEFEETVNAALDAAGPAPAAQLEAILLASLEPVITEPRKVAVWYAFSAEAGARRDYQEICGQRDQSYYARIQLLCDAIVRDAGPGVRVSSSAIAHAVSGLIEEFWQSILFMGAQFDRVAARGQCLAFLASVFPWAFEFPAHLPGAISADRGGGYTVRAATQQDLPALARLFDLYRQFYRQPADLSGAQRFLAERMTKAESVVFVAEDADRRLLGFTQLYPAICSVAMRRYWVLYDLFVDSSARRVGVGRGLMEHARAFAQETGAARIDLETAVDNLPGQRLYKDLGYVREQHFLKFSLGLGD
jgi:TetR/AcrR family transcriptional repressor of bet genes